MTVRMIDLDEVNMNKSGKDRLNKSVLVYMDHLTNIRFGLCMIPGDTDRLDIVQMQSADKLGRERILVELMMNIRF